ncbi:hypothetical protein EU527_10150 [Candidatus Thorarchaeota archaeon]|nr:MAG: hypothetical protein EU527_10150 [Candidatus Thorarchaeota archaeon]
MENTADETHWIDSLRNIARIAWSQAIRDFYHPPLPEPEIEHNLEASSFFYIDSQNWRVHLNTVGVPLHMIDEEAVSYLTSVCHHEIQHYLLCPFDGVMNGRMFSAARKHVNEATAMFVCNIFADFVVDSSLLNRFPSLTHSRINNSIHDSAMRVSTPSDLWLLIVTCYRLMWGFLIPPTLTINENTVNVAQQIIDIARRSLNDEHRWPKTCQKIAEIISKWLPEDQEGLPGCSTDRTKEIEQSDSEDGKSLVMVPLDVDGIMGSPVEIRNGDMAKKCLQSPEGFNLEEEMERLAIEVDQMGGNIDDLHGVYFTAGVGPASAEWTRFWYRAKAYGALRIEIESSKMTGTIPLTPEVWRLGDPLEELDLVQSLQTFPVLIPNRSTRKWQQYEVSGGEVSKSLPDMLLVIDSSGSMTWAMKSCTIAGEYHTALVSAFAAMDFAYRKGCRVSAINFSDGTVSCDWSKERAPVEDVLLSYQGGGTVAPIKQIITSCEKTESKVMALLITDAEVSNWNQMVDTVEMLVRRGHKLFMFHIGAGRSSRTSKAYQALQNAGASVYPIKSVKDLPGLVVREVRSVYKR